MRFAPALAASLAALFSACAEEQNFSSASERTLTTADDEAPAFLLEISGVTANFVAESDPGTAPGPEAEAPAADPLRDEVRATVDFAGVAAFAAADAGLARDRAIAEQRAVELASAAALVAQRVSELHASTAGGCDGGEVGVDVEVDPAVDDAALFSALAAEAAGNIASELNPPSQTVCSAGGCHSVCEEVPGTVDEIALGDAIDAVTDAGAGCAATVEIL